MKIVWFDNTGGGCDWYRGTQPLRKLAHLKLAETYQMSRADFITAAYQDKPEKLDRIMGADIIVIPRLPEKKFYDLVKDINPKAKIVMDYDDNIFDVSPLSPHYEDHGTEPVKIKLPDGQVLDIWADSEGYSPDAYKGQPSTPRLLNIKKNKDLMGQLRECMGLADLVTVTTDILADAFRPYAKNIAVLPNCVDFSLWRKLPLMPRAGLRMGWFGGSSHYEDLALLTEVLPVVLKKHPEITLVFMGVMFEGIVKTLPRERIEFYPWQPTPAYPYKAAILDLDFAIIPLRDTRFNACKSAIKWIEMAALEVPAVTSYVSPYAELATDDNGVWIENNDKDAWISGIELMATDAKLRKKLGLSAYMTVADGYSIDCEAHRWHEAYKGVLDGVPDTADLIKSNH